MSQLVAAGPRIDAATVGALRGSLVDAILTGEGPLVLDLSAVQTVDATGLAMLLGIQRRAADADRQLLLRGVPPRVARLLRATRLSRILRDEEPVLRPANAVPAPAGPAALGAQAAVATAPV